MSCKCEQDCTAIVQNCRTPDAHRRYRAMPVSRKTQVSINTVKRRMSINKSSWEAGSLTRRSAGRAVDQLVDP